MHSKQLDRLRAAGLGMSARWEKFLGRLCFSTCQAVQEATSRRAVCSSTGCHSTYTHLVCLKAMRARIAQLGMVLQSTVGMARGIPYGEQLWMTSFTSRKDKINKNKYYAVRLERRCALASPLRAKCLPVAPCNLEHRSSKINVVFTPTGVHIFCWQLPCYPFLSFFGS